MSPSRLQQLFCGGQGGDGLPVSSTPATQAALARETAVTRPLGMAIDLATELMDAHGLVGWRIKLDHARRRAGQCDYTNKIISLSRFYVRHADIDHIRDTILHEIAHALVGPRHGHDACGGKRPVKLAVPLQGVMICLLPCQMGDDVSKWLFFVERHRKNLVWFAHLASQRLNFTC